MLCWPSALAVSSPSSAINAQLPRLKRSARAIPDQPEIVAGDACASIRATSLAPNAPAWWRTCSYNIATALLIGWLTAEPWPPWYDLVVADVPARGR